MFINLKILTPKVKYENLSLEKFCESCPRFLTPKILKVPLFNSYISKTGFDSYNSFFETFQKPSKPDMSNWRPAGRMRPLCLFCAARTGIFIIQQFNK